MPSDRFRHELKAELRQWVDQGLINQDQWGLLVDRYELTQLDGAAKNRFVAILIGLGCFLIGLGLITFVAANWQSMGREFKVLLLLGLLAICNIGGFYLWQRSRDRMLQRLGLGIILIGSLVLGASMALFTQIFHLAVDVQLLFFWWSLGILAMAYGLREKLLGMLAIAIMGQAYWSAAFQGLWSQDSGQALGLLPEFTGWANYMPVIALGLFLPLAGWCRSRTLLVMAWIAVISAFFHSGTIYGNADGFIPMILAFTLPGFLLWGYDPDLWLRFLGKRGDAWAKPFSRLSKRFGGLVIGISLYISAVIGARFYEGSLRAVGEKVLTWPGLAGAILLVLVAIVQWVYLLRNRGRSYDDFAVLGLVVAQGVGLAITPISSDMAGIAGLLLNLLTAIWGIGLIRESLGEGDRSTFWYGMGLITMLILTKLLFSNSELLFKAMMLMLCGVGIVAAGVWFEKYVRSIGRTTS